ncbi:Ankyrin repeats (3 copies) [Legionella longbeachae]|nr:Ankyrin repeats (3 copies) [Legionella oakridgensis]STY20736.1 Ankyrin repeats (3 copies) [Legionella longbeachae]
MLCELFSWMNNHDGILEADHSRIIVRSEFESEQLLASEKRRKLLAALRILRFENPSDSVGITNASRQIEHHENFLRFMQFCRAKFETHEAYSLIQLGLEYLLSLEEDSAIAIPRQEKCTQLFHAFLEHQKEQAHAFYEANKAKLNEEIHAMVAVENVKTFLADLSVGLKHQGVPLGVAHLFKCYLDDTEKFAASLLWLVRQGVTAKDIVKTGLLHEFMLYHLSYLHDSESPVLGLYSVLKRFPEAELLIAEAARVRCEDRGFQRYNLTGVVPVDPDVLESVEAEMPAPEFTATPENFALLHELFNGPFTYSALLWYAASNHEAGAAFLREALNRGLRPEQLSALINGIASLNSPELLEKLASLLADATVEHLASLKHGSVFHLVTYMPALCRKISTMDMGDYLQKIPADTSAFDYIAQLMALFLVFRNTSSTVAVPVFEAIIDKLLSHPEFLDDSEFIVELRKFARKNTIIADKMSRLETSLDECIAEQTLTLPFVEEHYHAIEDTWFSVARQISSLREILPIPSYYPQDKYALQLSVAKALWAQHPREFALGDFFAALEMESVFNEENVNAYERMLIEIVTAIDDEILRQEIIRRLAEKYNGNEWICHDYGGGSLFNRAAKQGNVGFLTWLIEVGHFEPNRFVIRTVVTQAAEAHQWNMVEFFCRTMLDQLDRSIIKKLFKQAAEHGELRCVQIIHEKASHLLDKKSIEEAFKDAVANDHLPVVQFVGSLERHEAPCDAVQVKGFKLALASNQLAMAQYLTSLPGNRLMQQEVELALIEFAGKNDVAKVRLLCGLTENAPRQIAIERACERAASRGSYDALIYFCGLRENAPRVRTIENALRLAVGRRRVREVDALCHLSLNPPRPGAIEQAFIGAASANDQEMVRYFCTNEALLSRKAVDLGLQAAAQAGHLAIVQDIYLKAPSAKAVRYALRKATSAGHEAVVEFLRHPLAMAVSVSEPKPATLKRHLSVGEGLVAFGLFSPPATPLQKSLSYGCELSRLRAGRAIVSF